MPYVDQYVKFRNGTISNLAGFSSAQAWFVSVVRPIAASKGLVIPDDVTDLPAYVQQMVADGKAQLKQYEAGLAQLAAHNAGADLVKLFPTATMGLKYFKALRAPLSHIGLVVTAGIPPDNLGAYLKAGAFAAGISSPLCDKELIAAGDFAEITRRARAFRGIANPTVKA